MEQETDLLKQWEAAVRINGSSGSINAIQRRKKMVKNGGYFDKTAFSVLKRKYFYSVYISLRR